ncbi:ribonuclease HIII [Parageobacillus genomosp. 1]|uniref:Ribonuclease HIII n=1 Tax=Parageobacillus genomosp. 1 TaxID=1295642 RepID=A0ABC9VDF6_9BACL|nr:ribonuclease HIII [Parageobacillus genomosp. 1]EZP76407.1 ribonuclease HIII [Parageobacillus genomosp. 1]
MANHVITATATMLEKLRNHYASDITGHLPAGALFVAKRSGCTITAYRSGKVLFQGKEAEREAAKWMKQSDQKETPVSQPRLAAASAIGSDEVGTGDYFGPVVVTAAYVAKDQMDAITAMGVKDSKLLTDEAIRRLAPSLMSMIPHQTVILSNPMYNDWQRSGMPQTKIKALLHNEAIGKLMKQLSPIEPEAIIIDQFIERDLYFRYLENETNIVRDRVYCYPKAETVHVAVAVASMIARCVFLQEMERLSKEVGMTLPKGAGAQVDQAAAKLIQTHGPAILETCTKLHFANTEKAVRIAKQ